MKKIFTYLCLTVLFFVAIAVPVPMQAKAETIKVKEVQLNYNAYVLKKGQSVKLKASCLPKTAKNKKVKWKSSKPSVAVVSENGKVKAKKTGKTKITAIVKDGSKKKAVCTIQVVKTVKKIKKIQVSGEKTEIKPGETLRLKANLQPSKVSLKTLKWESSNTSLAKVTQKGIVKALAEGTVTITAKAQDGSGKKASYTVKIQKTQEIGNDDTGDEEKPDTDKEPNENEKPDNDKKPDNNEKPVVLVTELTFAKKKFQIREGKTMTIQPTVKPSDADNQVLVWKSSDESVVKADKTGKLTAVAEGTAVITAATTDGSNLSAEFVMEVLTGNITGPILITEIQFEENKLQVREGETITLQPEIYPFDADNQTLAWESSNEAVLKTDAQGNITAMAEGTAVLTATATDGSGQSASCEIEVLPKITLANAHTTAYYKYELDRNAIQYKKESVEEGKESESYMEAAVLSASVWKWSFYLNLKGGITTEKKFCDFIETVCKENAFAVFGIEGLTVTETAQDFQSLTISKGVGESARKIKMTDIKVMESGVEVTDPNGLTTKAAKIQFKILNEVFTMQIYDNGSRLAVYRSLKSPIIEFYQDNTAYTYVFRMSVFYADELKGKGFPNLQYMNMYNVY